MAKPNRDAAHPNAPHRLDARRRGLAFLVFVADKESAISPRKVFSFLADGKGHITAGEQAAHAHAPEPLDKGRPEQIFLS
jgi:hypothetical protein